MARQLLIPWFVAEPVVVDLGPAGALTLQPFALAVWAAVIVAVAVAIVFARRNGIAIESVLELSIFMIVFGFPISYFVNGLLYQTDSLVHVFREPSRILDVPLGWSSFGGAFGALVGGLAWKSWKGGSLLRVGEACAFAGPFGWTVGRLGCFIIHDHPGKVSDFFLAVDAFRVGTPPFRPRHDLGFYEMLVMAGIAIVFSVLVRKRRPTGFYWALFPLLYCPFRFLLDFLRAPATEGGDVRYGGLTPGQYFAIGCFVTGSVLMRRILVSSAKDESLGHGSAMRT